MEGIIFLAVLYFIFRAIVKKTKDVGRKATYPNPNAGTERNPARDASVPQVKRRKESPKPAPAKTYAPPPPQEPYQPIQPMLQFNAKLYDYTGSLGVQTGEGSVTTEGNAVASGSLSAAGNTEGVTTGEGGEVFSPDVLDEYRPLNAAYQTTPGEEPVRVLPEYWNRDEMVRAVVMHEIQMPPRGRRVYHG